MGFGIPAPNSDMAEDVPDPGQVKIQSVNPNFTTSGLWVQTGLGLEGSDITFWVEDGT